MTAAKPRRADPCTGKERFGTWDEAQQALVNAKIARTLHGRQKRREVASYYCGICHGHHLTSREPREWQTGGAA